MEARRTAAPRRLGTDEDRSALRTAAYGAISLMAVAGAAGKPVEIATDGSIALASETGPLGHVFAAKSEDIERTARRPLPGSAAWLSISPRELTAGGWARAESIRLRC
ncbi:hypothetical protein Q5425_02925 [Amycolatopsis sp. A133]|uniref:hypothetical protein n=1 Tax=Amycolatopsis sp. A133 TaxID=3064472 RepID=UPI0027ED39A6|nr:hypothetical protein [Amycolatopsis sp. A133]MDQ7802669.1 hypothetical protein [Amycolatopsis sp. A133]